MSFDYTKVVGTVDELLEQFGATTNIVNPQGKTIDTCIAVITQIKRNNTPNTITEQATALFLVPPQVTQADIPNFIRSNGILYKIVGVDPVRPGDTLLLKRVYVSN